MSKTKGFKIRVDYFLPIDKKDFAKQAAAYTLIAGIKSTKTLPDGFADMVTLIDVDAKEGSSDIVNVTIDTDPAPVDTPDEPPLPEVAEADKANGRRHKANPDEQAE